MRRLWKVLSLVKNFIAQPEGFVAQSGDLSLISGIYRSNTSQIQVNLLKQTRC